MKKTTPFIIILYIILQILMLTGCKYAVVTGGPVDHARLNDGVYEGISSNGPNSAHVRVSVSNQKIGKVELLSHDAWKGHKADQIIPERIVDKQSTDVDAVSGATNSSNVIMNAAEQAIQKSYHGGETDQ